MSNIKDKKVPNVPNLRFETCNTFIQCKIGDFANIKSGRDQKTVACENGNYPIYGTGGIFGKANNYVYNKPTVCIGRKGTIDRPFYIDTPFWCVDTLFYSEINENILPKYVFYLFQTINWKYYDQSTGVPSLTSSVIESIKVVIPEKTEQEKIAKFLTLIDERIATQNKIIDKLESLIKGISNKLISSCDMNFVPLGKISKIKKGEQINGLELTNSGYYYLNGGITHSGYTDNYNTNEDTISISEGGNSCGFVNYNKEKFWCGGHCYTIIPNRTLIDNLYLYYFLKNKENDIMRLRVGSGLPNIQKSTLEKFAIKLPCIDEQKRIAQILGNLNEKLGVYILLTEKLKEQKKFLLQNLFI